MAIEDLTENFRINCQAGFHWSMLIHIIFHLASFASYLSSELSLTFHACHQLNIWPAFTQLFIILDIQFSPWAVRFLPWCLRTASKRRGLKILCSTNSGIVFHSVADTGKGRKEIVWSIGVRSSAAPQAIVGMYVDIGWEGGIVGFKYDRRNVFFWGGGCVLT